MNLNITEGAKINGKGMAGFRYCTNLISIPNVNFSFTESNLCFEQCYNLVDVPYIDLSNCTNMAWMFKQCNNLSDNSIQNIINSVLNATKISNSMKSLSTSNGMSPFYFTNIDKTRYENRWAELDEAGWTY